MGKLLREFQKNNALRMKLAHLNLETLTRLLEEFLKLFQFRPGSGLDTFWELLKIGKA